MTIAGWIPVSERLPEPTPSPANGVSDDVLVWPRTTSPTAYYVHSLRKWWDSTGETVLHVTHWMPLPAGPNS